jgi:hypothetical protein
MLDVELDERLGQLEARVPGAEPPTLRGQRRIPQFLGGSLAGAILVLVAATSVVGGAVIVSEAVRGHPSVDSPGQPFFGAGLECMSPPEAEAYLADHGYTNTVWQVERDGAASDHVSTAPEHGYVIPGSIIDGVLIMIVDQRASATGTGDCFGDPMP